MSQTIKTHSSRLELDKAFQYAVTLAWEDLMKPTEPRLVRVEYLCEPGTALDHLSVWSVRAGGYQDRVCDYWARVSSAHPTSMRFENAYYSDQLALTLEFIMKNQGQFTRPADAGRHGSVQIHPRDADDRTEAATWMKVVQTMGIEASLEEAYERPRTQAQTEKQRARTSTDEEAHLREGRASEHSESTEAPAEMSSANYFELRYAWPE